MNKPALMAFLILATSWAQAQSVSIPNESFAELQKFQVNGQSLSANFVREFPEKIHQDILKGEQAFLKSLNGQCREMVRVTFGSHVIGSKDPVEETFESGVVKIEASKCFTDVAPTALIDISTASDFKRRAFSTLKEISSKGPQDCEMTQAPTIGRSHYCYLNFDLVRRPESQSQVNFLVFNDDRAEFDAPVYFREAFVSAHRMGPQTLYYVHSYVRSTQLSAFKKIFAEKYIHTAQSQVFQELERTLLQKRTGP